MMEVVTLQDYSSLKWPPFCFMPADHYMTYLPPQLPLNDVSMFEFNAPFDYIANEPDTLLRLTLQTVPDSELPSGLLLTNPLEITVQDGTGECIPLKSHSLRVKHGHMDTHTCLTIPEFSFGFDYADYSAHESEEMTEGVTVVFLDNSNPEVAAPIGITLTTLTFEDSIQFGNPHVIPPPDTSFSPNLAGKLFICQSGVMQELRCVAINYNFNKQDGVSKVSVCTCSDSNYLKVTVAIIILLCF